MTPDDSLFTRSHLSLLLQDQVSPWYRWWKSTVNVRLVVDPQLLRRRPSDESSQDRESHDGSRETATSAIDTL